MKKLYLLYILFIITLTGARAQTTYKAFALATGSVNAESSRRDVGEYKPAELIFKVDGQTVSINDKEQSVYHLTTKAHSANADGTQVNVWNAVDKRNTPCYFAILKSDEGTIFQIYYEEKATVYSYKIQNTGNYFDYDSMEPSTV